jgi:hypothetical protein
MILLDTDHTTFLKYPDSERGGRMIDRLNAVTASEVIGPPTCPISNEFQACASRTGWTDGRCSTDRCCVSGNNVEIQQKPPGRFEYRRVAGERDRTGDEVLRHRRLDRHSPQEIPFRDVEWLSGFSCDRTMDGLLPVTQPDSEEH